MWTPSSLALRHPTPHRAGALFWRPSPLPRLRPRPGGPLGGRSGTGPGRMARMAREPEPSRSAVPAVSRLGEDDWRTWREVRLAALADAPGAMSRVSGRRCLDPPGRLPLRRAAARSAPAVLPGAGRPARSGRRAGQGVDGPAL